MESKDSRGRRVAQGGGRPPAGYVAVFTFRIQGVRFDMGGGQRFRRVETPVQALNRIISDASDEHPHKQTKNSKL